MVVNAAARGVVHSRPATRDKQHLNRARLILYSLFLKSSGCIELVKVPIAYPEHAGKWEVERVHDWSTCFEERRYIIERYEVQRLLDKQWCTRLPMLACHGSLLLPSSGSMQWILTVHTCLEEQFLLASVIAVVELMTRCL